MNTIPISIDEWQAMQEGLLTIVKNIRHDSRYGAEGVGKCDFLQMKSPLNIMVREGSVQYAKATIMIDLVAADKQENIHIESHRWRRLNGGVLEKPEFFIPLQYSILQYVKELYLLIQQTFLGQPFFRRALIHTVVDRQQYCIELMPLIHKDFEEETKECAGGVHSFSGLVKD